MPISALTNPVILYSRFAVLANPYPVPQEPGAYAWFFKDVPAAVPTDGCITKDGLTLLYVGISPDKVAKPSSKQNLRKRITNHFRGNAEGSTLRRSLGVLLTNVSGYPLRRVGSGKRMTFTHLGEQWLDDWMEANAFVVWVEHPKPWELEEELLGTLSLPLNIKGNKDHLFADTLSQLRKEAIRTANETAVANEDNQQRREPSSSKIDKLSAKRQIAPDGVTEFTHGQIRELVLERFKSYLESPDGEPDDPFDLKAAINDDAPGRPREAWHMAEFAKVDDLRDKGLEIKEACEIIRRRLPADINYSGDDTSFRNIYYEFKREHENFVRRRSFAYSIFNLNFEEAIE